MLGRLACSVGIEKGAGAQDFSLGVVLFECIFCEGHCVANSLLQASVIGRTGKSG